MNALSNERPLIYDILAYCIRYEFVKTGCRLWFTIHVSINHTILDALSIKVTLNALGHDKESRKANAGLLLKVF